MKKPIYNWREIVGYANTTEQAKTLLLKILDVPTGFTLSVWERPDYICEIRNLPKGFVYSTVYKY